MMNNEIPIEYRTPPPMMECVVCKKETIVSRCEMCKPSGIECNPCHIKANHLTVVGVT